MATEEDVTEPKVEAKKKRRRNIVTDAILVLIGISILLVTGGALQRADTASRRADEAAASTAQVAKTVADLSATVNNLSDTLRRRSPIIDYLGDTNDANDCRDKLLYAFLFQVGQTVDDRSAALAAIAQLEPKLADIDKSCALPTRPQFDADGNLIPPATTTTTTPPGG